ncbi:MAG: hypothetical protein ACI3VP_07915, partial [Oscillospiraceae bacterium]
PTPQDTFEEIRSPSGMLSLSLESSPHPLHSNSERINRMYKILFVVVIILVGIYAELRSLERQRKNYDLDNRYNVLYHDLRSMPKYENLTDDEIKTRCFYLRHGSPDAVPPKEKRLKPIVLALLVLTLIAGVISCAVGLYRDGYQSSLEDICPGAYHSGIDTAEKMREFCTNRNNFCAICDRCRYDDEGREIEGHYKSLNNETVWICWHCISERS